MIRHVSLLTLVPETTADDLAHIADALAALPGVIDAIKRYEYGPDLGLAEGNATFAVVADFEDVAGYEQYRDHPQHRAVLDELFKPRLVARTVAQYEV